MSIDRTLQSIADVLAANEQHMVPLDPNRPELHWRDITGVPAPRPVPSPEDRMADARTDTPHTFRTYLDATDRDQLDARAAAAEQERDEALDDRDQARRERDQNAADLQAIADTNDQVRQELGAAGDVLAVVRDAVERIDRALATYDTTPRESCSPPCTLPKGHPNECDANAYVPRAELEREERQHGDTIDDRDQYQQMADRLAEAIARLTGADIGEHSSMNNPWENALQAATEAAEQRPAPSSVPPRRAQGPRPGQFCTEHFSWLCQAGQGRCQNDAEARP